MPLFVSTVRGVSLFQPGTRSEHFLRGLKGSEKMPEIFKGSEIYAILPFKGSKI